MHKAAVVTSDKDDKAYDIIDLITKLMTRHTGIDVDFYDKVDLSNLDDNETLYLLGHADPTGIGVDSHGKRISGTDIGNALVKQKLPARKKFRIRLLACDSGLYAMAKEIEVGKKKVKVSVADSFTRDLRNVMTKNKMQCTIEAPLGPVSLISGGDHVWDPALEAKGDEALGEFIEALAKKIGHAAFEKHIEGLEKLYDKMRAAIGKKALTAIADEYAHNELIYDPAYNVDKVRLPFCFKGNAGWRIVAC